MVVPLLLSAKYPHLFSQVSGVIALLQIHDDGCDHVTCFGQRNVRTSGMGNFKSSEQFIPSCLPKFPAVAIPSARGLEKGECESTQPTQKSAEHEQEVRRAILSH